MTMDRRQFRTSVPRVLVILLAMVAIGCGAAGDIDDTENAVILVINEIVPAGDQEHAFGDVVTSGTILDDNIDVEFAATLKATTGPPGSPTVPTLQDVVIERYQVEFIRTDGGAVAPAGFQRGMNLRVQLSEPNQTTLNISSANLVVAPSTIKAQQPIAFLIDPGFEPGTGFVNVQVDARITFFGRTLSGDPVTATGSIGINFADFGDST